MLEGSEKMPDASGLFTADAHCSSGPQRLAPTLTSHTLEAIQDTISDFFARVGVWQNEAVGPSKTLSQISDFFTRMGVWLNEPAGPSKA